MLLIARFTFFFFPLYFFKISFSLTNDSPQISVKHMKGFKSLALCGMSLVFRSYDPYSPSPFEGEKTAFIGGGPRSPEKGGEGVEEKVVDVGEASRGTTGKKKKQQECVIC